MLHGLLTCTARTMIRQLKLLVTAVAEEGSVGQSTAGLSGTSAFANSRVNSLLRSTFATCSV